jgi:hypothetical protein
MTCSYPEDCGLGLACAVDGSARICVPVCFLAGPPCVTGTCTALNAGDEYGVCL